MKTSKSVYLKHCEYGEVLNVFYVYSYQAESHFMTICWPEPAAPNTC